MQILDLWNNAQEKIKEEIGASSYDTWFSGIRVKQKTPETLIIETPDEFFKNWIAEHFLLIIQKHLLRAAPQQDLKIELIVSDFLSAQGTPPVATTKETAPFREEQNQQKQSLDINPRFTFDTFVVGPSNRFAYAASMAVAESPAKAYNPLFLYSHVGLGKTHLMQAITHQIKINHPQLNCYYISSENFTNELIESIRHKTTAQFRQKYRNIDVLLIDDIHFIAGKESTQEEFFHTFNALHNNRKQLIISSDRPPQEIAKLEDRLRSRFSWGLTTDIQPPDFETRVAILRKKSEREPVGMPDEIIMFIAEQIKTNIRELEGALIRVVAYSLLEETPISLDMAKIVLKDMVKETHKIISVEMIQKQVADYYQLTISDLKTKKRENHLLKPRQIAMFLSRQLTQLSLPEIGNAFGGKDHTTVLHSCKKIEASLKTEKGLSETVNKLISILKE